MPKSTLMFGPHQEIKKGKKDNNNESIYIYKKTLIAVYFRCYNYNIYFYFKIIKWHNFINFYVITARFFITIICTFENIKLLLKVVVLKLISNFRKEGVQSKLKFL